MLTECFNPGCRKELLYLRNGRIVRIVRNHQDRVVVEHFWLCDQCAHEWTLVQDESQAIALVPLSRTSHDQKETAAEAYRVAIS